MVIGARMKTIETARTMDTGFASVRASTLVTVGRRVLLLVISPVTELPSASDPRVDIVR